MTDWLDARVASISPAAEGLVHVSLDVSREVAASHTAPGQYVKLEKDGLGESFFAIASRPNPTGDRFDFLLKSGSALADAIAALAPGDVIHTTVAQGKGFPLDRAHGCDVVLVATGSGISPVRSLIQV